MNARHASQTALYPAIIRAKTLEAAILLLQAGASPFVVNNDGHLPVHVARGMHRPASFVRVLTKAMREPQRAWRLAQARAVLDARQAVQAVFRVLEEEKQKGGGQRVKALKLSRAFLHAFRIGLWSGWSRKRRRRGRK